MHQTLRSDTLVYSGEILCRIPDETPEIREVGRLLKEGKFQSTLSSKKTYASNDVLTYRQPFTI